VFYTGVVEVRGLFVFVVVSFLAAFALLMVPAQPAVVETVVLGASITADAVEPPDLLAAATSSTPPASASRRTQSTTTPSTTTTGDVPPSVDTTESTSPPTTIGLVAPRASVSSTAPVTTAEPRSVGEQALLLVRFDWNSRFPAWEITFLDGRSGIRALTYPREERIEVFVRGSDTPRTLHRVIAHELGHVIDVAANTVDDRNRWISQRGLSPNVPWWPGESAPDFATGAGDFAEAFAVWETGVQSQSSVAGQPTAEDLRVLLEIVG